MLYGFQAEGAAPLVAGQPVAEPETVASAIRIGNPARWEEAMDAVTASRGRIAAVSDEQILDAYRLLASARGRLLRAGLGGVGRGILAHGLPAPDGGSPPETVVCVLTGHGLKDPDTALGKAPAVIGCEADLAAVERSCSTDAVASVVDWTAHPGHLRGPAPSARTGRAMTPASDAPSLLA